MVSKLLKDLADARPGAAANTAPSVTPARPWSRSLLLPKPHSPPLHSRVSQLYTCGDRSRTARAR